MAEEYLRIDTSRVETQPLLSSFEIYTLVGENDPILRERTKDYDLANPPLNTVKLANSLFQTMFRNKGLGLAAPQVGISYSVFVIGADENNKQIFFNPSITEASVDIEVGPEGCLSFPGLVLKVKRPAWIKIRYQHITGDWREDRYEGLTARIICHEYDHLYGMTFMTQVGATSLKLAREKRTKLLKKIERAKNNQLTNGLPL